MRETDLLAFEIAVTEGQPGMVMCSYNKVNGDWACENSYLLDRRAEESLGLQGLRDLGLGRDAHAPPKPRWPGSTTKSRGDVHAHSSATR